MFSISASGAGIDGAADQFTFLHQRLTGDGMVTLRLLSLAGATTGEAGLMFRESLSASSRHVSILANASGANVRGRSTNAGGTAVLPVARAAWLRLERVGPVITASVSNDGTQWTLVAAQTMTLPSIVYVGIAVTSRSATGLATAMVSGMAVTPTAPTMPTGWSSVDVGTASAAGTASYSGSTFVAAGYGAGFTGTADGFRLIYTRVRGDAKLKTRVAAFQGTFGRQAGIVLRSTLEAGAVEAALIADATGVLLVKRTAAGQTISKTRIASSLAPVYLQLDRKASSITPSYSTDGSAWTAIPGLSLPFGDELYAGLAVASGGGGSAAAAFDQLSLVSVAANAPPLVSLTSPAAAQTFTIGQPVQFASNASDPDDLIVRVDFEVNNIKVATDSAAPYAASWTPSAVGSYSLTAVAVDSDGDMTASTPVAITVSGGANSAPLVSLTSPVAGRQFTLWQPVQFTANASDPDGSVVRVDFHINNTPVASDTTAPYAAVWTASAVGNYSLTAVATDSTGATTTSTPVAISVVSGAASSAPLVSLTSPVGGQQFTLWQPVQFTANASDPDGSVVRVDFHINNTPIASDTAAPYAAVWTASAVGNYSLTAVATDSTGATTTSTPVAISVLSAGASSASPLVSLTSPVGGQQFKIWQPVQFTANASDPDDPVVRVDFRINNVTIASDTVAPYTAAWTAVALGNYSVTAVAIDAAGHTTASAPVAISVVSASSTTSPPPSSTPPPPPPSSSPAPPPTSGTGPWRLEFVPSYDHATVSGYTLEIALQLPLSLTLMVNKPIGKPSIGPDGKCVIDIDLIVQALPAGTYQLTVKAQDPWGTTASLPVYFAR